MRIHVTQLVSNPLILAIVIPLLFLTSRAQAQYSRTPRSREAAHSPADDPYTSGPYTFKPVPYSNGAMVQIFDTKTGKGVGTVINGNVVAGADKEAIQAAYDAHIASLSKSGTAASPSSSASGNATPSAAAPASTPAPASAVSAPATVSGFKYGMLDRSMTDKFPTAILLDLALFRLKPELLDDKLYMRYFIALNNCNDQSVAKMLDNELDYPDLAAQYKARAPEILKAAPSSIRITLYRPAANAGNWSLWAKLLTLGDYNKADSAFPFNFPGAKNGVEITGTMALTRASDDRQRFLSQGCPVASQKTGIPGYGALPANYSVTSSPMTFKEFPLDEASARRYIDKVSGHQRAVVLNVDLHLLDASPALERTGNKPVNGADFKGEIGRITVIDSLSGQDIGVLYDNHTLPPPEPPQSAAEAPAPQTKGSSVNWSASDHLYDIRMSVYVFLAHDACNNWPLTDAQSANLKAFLNRVQNGKYQEREQYNASFAAIKNAIAAKGRMEYCSDRMERRDYDNTASKVAPLGPLTTSTY